jgi:hypothetical protein
MTAAMRNVVPDLDSDPDLLPVFAGATDRP